MTRRYDLSDRAKKISKSEETRAKDNISHRKELTTSERRGEQQR